MLSSVVISTKITFVHGYMLNKGELRVYWFFKGFLYKVNWFPYPQTKNYRPLRNTESRRNSLPQEQNTNWLFNAKWSALKSCTQKAVLYRLCRLYLYIQEHIQTATTKEAMNLKLDGWVTQEEAWREKNITYYNLNPQTKKPKHSCDLLLF